MGLINLIREVDRGECTFCSCQERFLKQCMYIQGVYRPVLTGICPLDRFPGARTPRGEGKEVRYGTERMA